MQRSGKALVYHDGAAAHARLYGPLNLDTAPCFEAQLERSLRRLCSSLSLDLGAAEYVDSDGIRWLQRLQGNLAERGIDLSLAVREGSHAERTFRQKQDAACRDHSGVYDAPDRHS